MTSDRMTDAELAALDEKLEHFRRLGLPLGLTPDSAAELLGRLLAEVRRLRGELQLHAGDTLTLKNEVDARVEEIAELCQRLALYEPPDSVKQSYFAAALRACCDDEKSWHGCGAEKCDVTAKADKIRAIMRRAAHELDKYEPPEGERDETMSCASCGSTDLRPWYDNDEKQQIWSCGSCIQQWWTSDLIPRWRYDLAERIKRGT